MAEVARPLLSVGKICDRGNQVVFGRSGGVVVDLVTGEETPFVRDKNGLYQLEFWMAAGPQQNSPSVTSGFRRPGQ